MAAGSQDQDLDLAWIRIWSVSGSGLDLAVECLGLDFEVPELSLDQISQRLPHLHLTPIFREKSQLGLNVHTAAALM